MKNYGRLFIWDSLSVFYENRMDVIFVFPRYNANWLCYISLCQETIRITLNSLQLYKQNYLLLVLIYVLIMYNSFHKMKILNSVPHITLLTKTSSNWCIFCIEYWCVVWLRRRHGWLVWRIFEDLRKTFFERNIELKRKLKIIGYGCFI